MMRFEPGMTTVVTAISAQRHVELEGAVDGWEEATLSGIVTVVELCPYEPSNYQHEDGLIVESERDGNLYYISEYLFTEQIWPKAHGRMLEDEREMELYEEPEIIF